MMLLKWVLRELSFRGSEQNLRSFVSIEGGEFLYNWVTSELQDAYSMELVNRHATERREIRDYSLINHAPC
jgi:hypothetical protein